MKRWDGRAGRAALTTLLGTCLVAAPGFSKTGDLNYNNGIDRGDAAIAVQIAAGLANGLAMNSIGDVAGPAGNTPDGKIDLLDAVRIVRTANGLDNLDGGSGGIHMVGIGTSVTISGNTVKNVQLPIGYQLTGTVKDTNGLPITTAPGLNSKTGSISFTNAANSAAVGTGAVATDGTFSAVLPQGVNTAKVSTVVTSYDFSVFKFTSYSVVQTPVPASVSMTQNATQAFVRPDLPATGTISGSITSPDVALNFINFSLSNGGSGYTIPDPAAYSIIVPPGQGHVSVSGSLASDSDVYTNAQFNGSAYNVVSGANTTFNITLPAMATLHGVVTPPTGVTVASGFIGSVGSGGTTHYGSSSNMTATPNAYKLAVPPGSYLLAFMATSPSNGPATWLYMAQTAVPAGDTLKNLTLPALPAVVNLSGQITGPDGKPAASADISVYPMDTPTSGWSASADIKSGPTGYYSVRLPAGNYGILVSPPGP